jgi:hypothetical protein
LSNIPKVKRLSTFSWGGVGGKEGEWAGELEEDLEEEEAGSMSKLKNSIGSNGGASMARVNDM